MAQTKLQSLTEAVINVIIGYTVGITGQMIIFPLLGIAVQTHEHLLIGLFFTAVSLIRSYFVRRLFNKLHKEHIL